MNADFVQPVLSFYNFLDIHLMRWDNLHTNLLAASFLAIYVMNKKFHYKMLLCCRSSSSISCWWGRHNWYSTYAHAPASYVQVNPKQRERKRR
jgi:hypothetical protein